MCTQNHSNKSPANLEESKKLRLQFTKRNGLIPVTVQESSTGEILMTAYVNREAFEYSIKHKKAAFWSTGRNELWVKGLTSGNTMHLDEILVDCDQDALVFRITLESGGACHTKNSKGIYRKSCFYRKLNIDSGQLEFK